jgi:hypothetical protein
MIARARHLPGIARISARAPGVFHLLPGASLSAKAFRSR